MGNDDLVRTHLILRRIHTIFNGENYFKMQVLEPEICLFENACFT